MDNIAPLPLRTSVFRLCSGYGASLALDISYSASDGTSMRPKRSLVDPAKVRNNREWYRHFHGIGICSTAASAARSESLFGSIVYCR
jgi:hypothetical protein